MLTAPRIPYPGLRPFEAEDQPVFFGREGQVNALLSRMEETRFLAVVGSSGAGKSSLVRAGLLPTLDEGFLPGRTNWIRMTMRPGHRPFERLTNAMVGGLRTFAARRQAADDDAHGPPDYAHEHERLADAIRRALRRTDRGLLAALEAARVPPHASVVLVVDQFEELFAFRRSTISRDDAATRDEAAAFVRLLLDSSACGQNVWVVLTMRSDFIGDCETFLGLPEAVSESQFLVPRLDRQQMHDAIVRPGEVRGAEFEPFTFADGLVNRIINEAGDRPDQLPLMQHALMRTWKRAVTRWGTSDARREITDDDYDKSGTIERALAEDAEAAFAQIETDATHGELARVMFLLLADISPDGQLVRRRPTVGEVLASAGVSVADVEHVARAFQQDDRNFLLPPLGDSRGADPETILGYTPDTRLDVSHEALLRRWPRFTAWAEREAMAWSELRRLVEMAELRKHGFGGLLSAQDLDRVRRWRSTATAEWARRYIDAATWDDVIRFIDDSETAEREGVERETARHAATRKLKTVGLAVGTVAVVAIGVAVYSSTVARQLAASEARANAESMRARSRQVAAAAMTHAELAPDLALALAAEAVKIAPTIQAESALRRTLSVGGEAPSSEQTWIDAHKGPVLSVAFSSDGSTFVTSGCDGTARLWRTDSHTPVRVLDGHRAPVNVAAFSVDSRLLVTAGGHAICDRPPSRATNDTTVRVWDVTTGALTHSLEGANETLMGAAFSPDGQVVGAVGGEGLIHIWELATGKRTTFARQEQSQLWISFSRDGRYMATAGRGVTIWDRPTGARVASLDHGKDVVLTLSYSSDGKLLASADINGNARLWDTATWELRRELTSRTLVNAADFSADGRFLLTAGAGVQIWEVATGAKIRQLSTVGNFGAAFSPDGRTVVLGTYQGRLGILKCDVCVPLEGLLQLLRARNVRALTARERADFVDEPSQ